MLDALANLFGLGAGTGWLAMSIPLVIGVLVSTTLTYRRRWIEACYEHQNSRDLIEHLSEGIYRSSIDGQQLSANKALVKLNGYSSEAEMLASVHDIGGEWYVEPGRRDEFRRVLHSQGHVEDFVSEIYRHKTRERIWISESARIVRHNRTGKPLFYEGSVREITETIKRLKLEEHYKKLITQIPGGLFQYRRNADGSFRVLYYSEGFHRLTGIPNAPQAQIPETFTKLIVPEDLDAYYQSLRECHRAFKYWDHEFRIRTPDGVEKWLRASAAPERVGGAIVWHGYACDISPRKRQELEIKELAYFDPLTHLPNRRALLDRLRETLERTRHGARRGALLFIDLDNFKTLNDSEGHDTGDAYLVQVAGRLLSCVEPGDLVARIGGDEFVVCIEDAGATDADASARANHTAEAVLRELAQPHLIGAVEHQASASVGIVVFDGNEPRVDEVLKRADIAMYRAKASGRNAMALFDPSDIADENEQFRLVADLRTALAEDRLCLHFQPQVDQFGRIISAEALLRWTHPELGPVGPDRFIPLAEKSGLIHDLCRMVLSKGVRTLAGWQANPDTAHLRLSINVSPKSFSNPGFVAYVRQLIEEHAVDASRLMLEFTEQMMAENQKVTAERMHALRRLGIRFSLDDFGTGYSSLADLRQMPFDELKIDGSFVADIETRESDRALVRTILAMADTLGLAAVAEHVETAQQETLLRAFGCRMFQGYLYAPPLAADEFLARARVVPSLTPTAEALRLRA
ncbi:PAS domain S-box-containing protein/diguanylate cyclase (GGDEF) domain-containing protein [Mesorhizobium australicum]|uniref:PAS domain S-box-containing protein/diguanylate cyclase (GGDEF) domain-containing protein n=2 Tax=Mesorhizobium australicum TaxID=536018 RepID=A0A1X7P2Q9_9HYPH|nr:PAS domain S-box-containing protein/diguanylate cyclase (GGDEF) domain-containing protein [Mesorhizobium australicum]